MKNNQKGFGFVGVIIVLVVLALVGGAGYMVLQKNKDKSSSKVGNAGDNSSDMPTCDYKGYKATAPRKNAVNAVTSGPTDIKNIKYLLNHASTNGDMRFVYMVNNTDEEIPVYAPADGRLVYVINKHADNWDIVGGRPSDFDLTFTVDCKSFWRINHVVSPVEAIKNAEPNEEVVELEAGKGLQDEWGWPKTEVYVKAGEQIGTTAVPTYTQWDIGYFKDGEATCIFNELIDGKQSWLDLMSPVMGMNAKPVPGTACEGQTGEI